MLTYIHVDGFRSLSDFAIEIRPSLNILIGPNGGGKSNIISFFQFLSRLMRTGLNDAVSLTGGAGAFFQKTGEATFEKEVRATVRGLTYIEERNTFSSRGWVQYEYMFVIRASERFDSIIFSEQKVKMRGLTEPKSDPPLNVAQPPDDQWDLVIESCAESPQLKIPVFRESWLTIEKHRPSLTKEDVVNSFKEDADEAIFQSTPLVRFPTRYFTILRYIAGDLIGGETLNINPSKVKEPEDIAREPGIRSDGSGLAATLWHIHNEDPTYRGPYGYMYSMRRMFPFAYRGRFPKKVYGQLQSLFQLVNPQIKTITVDNDPFDNQLKIKVSLLGPSEDVVVLPLGAMSDGTIKWASLITAILTYPSIFAIEEPENFLHPNMLIEIIKLMRSTTEDKFSFVIMTTHSETLLNAANPNEVIVVSMDNGVTRGRRPSDPEHLANEIRETGFGLGYYYLAGALSDA